jgi:hypothetical protein
VALTHVLLFFHLLGAVSFFAGAAVAGTLQLAAALGLWVASMALGGYGGRTARHARHLAEQLTAEGDVPSPELRALVAVPAPLWASYASGLMLFAILALMVWQPA